MPVPPTVIARKLLRARNFDLGLLLEDSFGGNADVVIVGERLADQFLKLRLAIDSSPLFIAKGSLASLETAVSSAPR